MLDYPISQWAFVCAAAGAVVAVLSLVLPTAVSLNGVPLIPHVLSAAGVTAFIYYFFSRVAMPRFGGSLRDDADEIVRQWALTALLPHCCDRRESADY